MTYTTKNNVIAIFDIDGTILNTRPKYISEVKSALLSLNPSLSVSDKEIDEAKGWYELSDKYGLDRAKFDREFDRRKPWEQALRASEAPLFEDTLPTLERLASEGVMLGVLTQSTPEYTKAKLDFHNLNKYFGNSVEVTSTNEESKRAGAINLIRKIGPKSISRAYFIGDKANDVLVAEDVAKEYKLNTSGIYVNRSGSTTPRELVKYNNVRSLEEIPRIIGAKYGR